jgi:hypothetical protein
MDLDLIDASGAGFTGDWIKTNGVSGGSAYLAEGLAYPDTYMGTNIAAGGSARNEGDPGKNSMFRLNFNATTYNRILNSQSVYISFLAERRGLTVTEEGKLDYATRVEFNLASEYPRNFGFRLMTNPGSNNSGKTIGKPSDWNSNNVVFDQPTWPIVDTWGVGGFNDVHKLYTGANFANGVDHVVIEIHGSDFIIWVNPQPDGSSEGVLAFTWTDDGDPETWNPYGIGVETGSGSGDRPFSSWVFDEIIVADSFEDAAGFAAPPPPEYWNGYLVEAGGYVDTGKVMGWLNITNEPWVYVFDWGQYVYLPEGSFSEDGNWTWNPPMD